MRRSKYIYKYTIPQSFIKDISTKPYILMDSNSCLTETAIHFQNDICILKKGLLLKDFQYSTI